MWSIFEQEFNKKLIGSNFELTQNLMHIPSRDKSSFESFLSLLKIPPVVNFDQIFLQKPKACKNPCKYKSWEGWGSFLVNDPSYPANTAAVAAGYPEVRNARQRMTATVFTDMKVQLPAAAADNTKFPMR